MPAPFLLLLQPPVPTAVAGTQRPAGNRSRSIGVNEQIQEQRHFGMDPVFYGPRLIVCRSLPPMDGFGTIPTRFRPGSVGPAPRPPCLLCVV